MGKCPGCGSWETLIEEVDERGGKAVVGKGAKGRSAAAAATSLADVDLSTGLRVHTKIAEVDRVLGGGLMAGSIVLVGGDPGMGKSTLMLQVCASVPSALYVTGEESLQQIRQRADRLGIDVSGITVAAETNIESIVTLMTTMKPSLVVIDSVQTMTTEHLESSAGSVAQVRECTALVTRVAKSTSTPVIVIGHVTKDGMIAGPKVLEHMVDTVLQFEGDGMYSYRVLRAIKNRYGSTNEIGVFDMTSEGLVQVTNPSEVLLSNHRAGESGTSIVAVMEGSRPLLVEVQALVSPTGYAVPQRVATGFDGRRLQMILAVLEKRGGVSLRQSDVFVNIAGGISIQDPAVDIGVAVALVSSAMDIPLGSGIVLMGEIGLTGEVRRIAFAEQRVQEAVRLGLTSVVVPQGVVDSISTGARHYLRPVERVSDVLQAVLAS